MAERTQWPEVIDHAAAIVRSYDTSVTLRQLFYRLVSDGTLTNTTTAYKMLSDRTTRAREDGRFPELIDRGREIHGGGGFSSPEQARAYLKRIYYRNRTEQQDVSIFLGVEKAGMVVQLESWFGDLGVPILALGGYASHSYKQRVKRRVLEQSLRYRGRDAVLLYAGDHDPSGEDIDRDFVVKTDCWADVVRVALHSWQVTAYNLDPMPGKTDDSRAAGFIAKHGELRQVELDALDPNDLRGLFQQAITDAGWSDDAYQAVLEREAAERESL